MAETATGDVMEGQGLTLEVRETPLVTIVRCSGRIVYGGEAFALVRSVMSADTRYILMDLGGVSAVDAAGLGALAQLERWARGEQRTIHLVNLSRRVRDALEATGLSSVLKIFPPSEAAPPRGLIPAPCGEMFAEA
jgi:anti-anti-sigma factor